MAPPFDFPAGEDCHFPGGLRTSLKQSKAPLAHGLRHPHRGSPRRNARQPPARQLSGRFLPKKGRLSKHEDRLLDQPWKKVREGVTVNTRLGRRRADRRETGCLTFLKKMQPNLRPRLQSGPCPQKAFHTPPPFAQAQQSLPKLRLERKTTHPRRPPQSRRRRLESRRPSS